MPILCLRLSLTCCHFRMMQLRSNKQNPLHECAKRGKFQACKSDQSLLQRPSECFIMVSNLKNFPGEHAPGPPKQHRAFGAQRSPPTIPRSPPTHFLIESPGYRCVFFSPFGIYCSFRMYSIYHTVTSCRLNVSDHIGNVNE